MWLWVSKKDLHTASTKMWPITFLTQVLQNEELQYTQRGVYKVPLTPRFFMNVDSHSLSRTVCSMQRPTKSSSQGVLSRWSAGEHTADCRSFGWQDISSSGLATKTLIFFIWEQIMQQSDKSIKRLSIPMYISPNVHAFHANINSKSKEILNAIFTTVI